MSFPENSSWILHFETWGTGFDKGLDGGWMSMLGAAGVAGEDYCEAVMSEGFI